MSIEQRATLIRSFLFIFSAVALVVSGVTDMYFRDVGHERFQDWIVYWTHLSNIGVFIWSFLALLSLFLRNKKFERIINTWYLKFTVTTFIIVTSTVFISFALIPIILASWFKGRPGLHGITAGELALITIFSTLLLHLVVPGLMTLEFLTSPKTSASLSKMSNHDKAMKLAIIPPLYFIFVLLMTSYGAKSPYPIFDFANPPDVGIFSTLAWQWFSLCAGLLIGVWFVGVARILLRYENSWKNRYVQEKNRTN